jgi:DASS family divalent anion:Na+ symporter
VAALAPGVALYFIPIAGLSPAQSHLLAVFVSTIVALMVQPAPMGVSVVIAMTALALTRTLPPAKVLSGFSNVTLWLIFTAFLFSRAVASTGLGTRVAHLLIERFARSPLTLGYSLAAANVALAPFVPSDTARGGGVIFPVTRSVAVAFGSEPGPTAGRIGAYLMLTGFHANYIVSALFLTSMAANPLIAEFASKIGHVELTWMRWFSGSIVPGLLSLLIVPWLIVKMCKPEITDTTLARDLSRAELARIGPLKRDEKWLIGIMLCVMAGWVTNNNAAFQILSLRIPNPWFGVSNTFVALAGLSAILIVNVLSWDDLLSEKSAWDALIWFAPLLMMSDALNETGVIKFLSQKLFGRIDGWPWPAALLALVLAYLYIHYGFASLTAHTTALYPGFLAAALATGAPPLLAALPLAYFSNLNAGITHYGTGSAPIFFGAGYVRQGDWWRIGFLISVVNLIIWLGVGTLWWKLIGLW